MASNSIRQYSDKNCVTCNTKLTTSEQATEYQQNINENSQPSRINIPREPAMKPKISAFSGRVTLLEFLNISCASIICSFYSKTIKKYARKQCKF